MRTIFFTVELAVNLHKDFYFMKAPRTALALSATTSILVGTLALTPIAGATPATQVDTATTAIQGADNKQGGNRGNTNSSDTGNGDSAAQGDSAADKEKGGDKSKATKVGTLTVAEAVKVSNSGSVKNIKSLPSVGAAATGQAKAASSQSYKVISKSNNADSEDTVNIVNTGDTVDSENAVNTGGNGNNEFRAYVHVFSKDGVSTITVKNEDNVVDNELTKVGVENSDIRLSNGSKLDGTGSLENGDELVVYKNHKDVQSKEIEIKPSVEYVDDSTLPKGTEVVESEGKSGKAIETTVALRSPGEDGELNLNADKFKENVEKASDQTSTTISETPEKKIVRRGTLETPEPTYTTSLSSSSSLSSSNGWGGRAPSDGSSSLSSLSPELTKLQSETQNAAVKLALAQVGKPYVWGAVGPSAFDCSGLIYWVYNTNLGKPIPRVAGDQGNYSKSIPGGWANVQPGDIIWKNNEHIGMYIGDGKMVHASTPETGVIVSSVGWAQAEGFQVGRFE